MRQRLLLDRNWRFALGHATDRSRDFEFVRDRSLVKAGEARGAAGFTFDDSAWRRVDLPHDWAIELPLVQKDEREHVEHGSVAIGPDFPEKSVGWYRRTFVIPKRDLGRRISVEFDGVFRDSVVWINGHRLGRHASGYIGFRYDLTDYLNYGGKNVLAVRVDASCYEGWWYEGAGIYRHVWLVKSAPVHIGHWGTFITSRVIKDRAEVTVQTTIVNDSDNTARIKVGVEILGPDPLPGRQDKRITLQPWTSVETQHMVTVRHPQLWSCDEPNLYTLRTTITQDGKTLDTVDTSFGIRTIRWDARRGFFLNGKPVKIKGMCFHRDHAGVGVALPDRLHTLRIEKLKSMGANAFRASHYPHAPELLDACDRLGILVMAENRISGSSPQVLGNLEAMIRRDRNHPSIILWSLSNEEHSIQWSIAGEHIGRTMVRTCHRLDPTRKVTAAMHDKGLDVGFANILDIHGWNYINVGDIEAYHRKHPERIIIGSEEASTVTTRGIYADDPARGYVRAYDERAPKWGSTAESWWKYFVARPWLAGAFVWTAFDYRGEPIPYKWPCIASHFGVMDLCGFPKDLCYYYKSWWSDQDVLHLFPHWNWPGREGEEIDVRCFTNCAEVELFVNGRSLRRKPVEPNSHVAWKVRYEPGELKAVGYRRNRKQSPLVSIIETTGKPVQILLTPDRPAIRADGEDVCCVTVSVADAKGRPVSTADNRIQFSVNGPGRLLGVGNGDPSGHESDRAPHRRLFNGLALAILQSDHTPGTITLTASAKGLRSAKLALKSVRCAQRPAVP